MSTNGAEQLTVGTVIVYHLLPSHNPIHPERTWRGKIIKTVLCQKCGLDVILVESLEEDYEGLREYVLLTQIIWIEWEGENCRV